MASKDKHSHQPHRGKGKKKGLTALIGVAIPLAAALGWVGTQSSDDQPPHSTGDSCPYSSLPKEAQKQIDDILTGAPADDGPHDGKHFGNYEGRLPKEPSNFYREYTVKTPGLDHRGERRIVVGGGSQTDPQVWYYSSDHYESFCSIPQPQQQR